MNRWLKVEWRLLAALWAMLVEGFAWSDARWRRENRRLDRLTRLVARGSEPWHPLTNQRGLY
jgi:hypothetical protein